MNINGGFKKVDILKQKEEWESVRNFMAEKPGSEVSKDLCLGQRLRKLTWRCFGLEIRANSLPDVA
jgi:hypothetical protein